jgi:hypothetical protein
MTEEIKKTRAEIKRKEFTCEERREVEGQSCK